MTCLVSFYPSPHSIQTPSAVITKTFETSASINLRPPPIDRHKSFDEDEISRKPIVPKKVHTPPVNAISYSIADLSKKVHTPPPALSNKVMKVYHLNFS
ncbi:hypothetical protein ACSBR1_006319 [Camellia fascicularis]